MAAYLKGAQMKNHFKSIYPIVTCKLLLDKGMFTYRMYYGEKIAVPIYAWLIKGDEEPILVDTGCSLEEMLKYSYLSAGGEKGPPIEDSLQKMGVSAGDIKTIVITHLHADHVLNAEKFPYARVIVQKEDLKFARNPHPLFTKSYHRQLFEGLNLETISGNTEVVPGVEVFLTPGHSPGCQSVSVTTTRGKAVITGFCCIDENFGEGGDIVPGIHTDLYKAYDSVTKTREIADIILPLHGKHVQSVESVPQQSDLHERMG